MTTKALAFKMYTQIKTYANSRYWRNRYEGYEV